MERDPSREPSDKRFGLGVDLDIVVARIGAMFEEERLRRRVFDVQVLADMEL
jgi:hypothetical protein